MISEIALRLFMTTIVLSSLSLSSAQFVVSLTKLTHGTLFQRVGISENTNDEAREEHDDIDTLPVDDLLMHSEPSITHSASRLTGHTGPLEQSMPH